MDIIVDEIIAILQILTFRDTVCSNQYIDILLLCRHQLVSLLGYWREECQNTVEICFHSRNSRGKGITSYKSCLQSCLILDSRCQIIIEIFSGIRESRKDDYFLVVTIDGMSKFITEIFNKHLKLTIMLRGNIL